MEMRTIVAALVGFAAVALSAPAAEAANRFALTCFENKTDIALNYRTRWGNGEWSRSTLAPGGKRWHSFKYDRPDQNSSPVLHVSFDGDLSTRMYSQQYSLKSYASPQEGDCARYGKEYVFRYDGSAKKYIDLRERN